MPVSSAESLFPRLEPLLPQVSKPVQYVGGELNATVKEWGQDDETVRWALMYPDAYEVGLPNQGVQILYEVLNERDGVLAERTYSVWPDLEKLMRENGIGQFTVDAHRPVAAFDLLGISFATELGYTNMLAALDLAGIPLDAVDRTRGHRGRARGVQPRADRRLRRCRRAGRRRGDRVGHHRGGPRVEGRSPARWPGRAAGAAGRLGRSIRPQVLRRQLPAGRADPACRAEPSRRSVAGAQTHRDGSRQLAVPAQAAGAAGRDGA